MIRFFRDDATSGAIRALSRARRLTVVVGAGASVEVGLPGWSQLVSAALSEVLSERGWKEDCERLVERAHRDGPMSAAQVLSAFVRGSRRDALIRRHLYGSVSTLELFPGPLVRSIARLQAVSGQRMTIVTTNYDDMLEEALRLEGIADVRTYVRTRDTVPRGAVGVTHLHGFLGPRRKGDVILSEADYHRMQLGSSWQERLMVSRLDQGPCMFVGASLTDPNLLRYLHGHRRRYQHYAVFAREDAQGTIAERQRGRWETAERARWAQVGVMPLFADNYADIAQFVHEVALRRDAARLAKRYSGVPARVSSWFDGERRSGVLRLRSPAYNRLQARLARELARSLASLRDVLVASGNDLGNEVMQLGLFSLWLPTSVRRRGREEVVLLATSDRLMRSAETLAPIPLQRNSSWTGVRAICDGVPLSEEKDTYASRWHFMRGVPVYSDAPRHPLGSIVIASTRSRESSVLGALSARELEEVDRFLARTGELMLGGSGA